MQLSLEVLSNVGLQPSTVETCKIHDLTTHIFIACLKDAPFCFHGSIMKESKLVDTL